MVFWKSEAEVPKSTQAIVVQDPNLRENSVVVASRAIPELDDNEVLIRMEGAPIHPADLISMRGGYFPQKAFPFVPGTEGCGTVVRAGRSLYAKCLLHRRVAFAASEMHDGTWAEYVVTQANHCIPQTRHLPLGLAATSLVNPFTAWALIDFAKKSGHVAIANTAAASSLGRMLVRLGKRFSIPVVCIVRKEEQEEILKRDGAEWIINTTPDDFVQRMSVVFQMLGVTLALDAVGGDLSGKVLTALPPGGTLMLYGALSGAPVTVKASDLIFSNKQVQGFHLSDFLKKQTTASLLKVGICTQSLLKDALRTEVQAQFHLNEIQTALQTYHQNMSGGKVLLTP